jgi:hypothetical protein
MSSPYSRTLPPRPDLAQQSTQAKELLERFADGDPEARDRVRAALPDKQRITLADAQFVLAREYGFVSWADLKRHIESVADTRSTIELVHDAFGRRDAAAVRRILASNAELRGRINDPLFSFNSPAIVAFANDAAMVDVLLEFGADPNRRSEWWAGPFHALHVATGAAAQRLLDAGAVPDACAAAHLDRRDLLARMIADDPACVHQRGGDGQTPLHFARSREVVDLLLSAGADIDARDSDHRATAAEWMLDRTRGAGRYDLARYLVDRGATADIFLVAALGLTDRARTMLEREPALLDLRTGRGAYGERPPSSQHIYFWTIGDGRSPLDVAAQFGQDATMQAMLGSRRRCGGSCSRAGSATRPRPGRCCARIPTSWPRCSRRIIARSATPRGTPMPERSRSCSSWASIRERPAMTRARRCTRRPGRAPRRPCVPCYSTRVAAPCWR